MKFLLIAGFAESLINFRGPLIDALLDAQLEVHVVAPFPIEASVVCAALEEKGVQVHHIDLNRTGLNPFSDLLALIALWGLMRRVRPDYVLAYTIKPVIYGSLAAWLAGVPHRASMITGLGYAFQGDDRGRRALQGLVQKLYQIALAKNHTIFFQNPDDHALFEALQIVKSSDHCVIVNGSGVDLDHYKAVPVPSRPGFLLIARLLGGKGVREYVRAAEKVRARYPDVEFGLVGWLDTNPDSVKQAELDSWIDAGTVVFHGKLSDVRQVISRCSAYVLPSYREGTPRTVLEAMAMGRAIITSDAPGCRETVNDGENGLLVPVQAVDELAEAMIRLVEHPALAVKMGARSRQIVEQRYDVHKVNANMLNEMGVL